MKFGVVIVTYNRLDKLKQALMSYTAQSYQPSYILVVDNHSTDDTAEFLKNWQSQDEQHHIIYILDENLGGSGGFYYGLNKAMSLKADWIWVADDDLYADKDCLLHAHNFLANRADSLDSISAICGTVSSPDGIVTECRRRISQKLCTIKETNVPESEYNQPYFLCDLLSYAGGILNKNKLKEVGLTEKDYFIYYDDTEHSYRLSKVGKIYCIPNIKTFHDVPAANHNNPTVSWKHFYSIRNYLLFIKKHFPARYYHFASQKIKIKSLLRTLLRHHPAKAKMEKAAIRAAKDNQMGIDATYNPRWREKA